MPAEPVSAGNDYGCTVKRYSLSRVTDIGHCPAAAGDPGTALSVCADLKTAQVVVSSGFWRTNERSRPIDRKLR
jgi:hypothetical protein